MLADKKNIVLGTVIGYVVPEICSFYNIIPVVQQSIAPI